MRPADVDRVPELTIFTAGGSPGGRRGRLERRWCIINALASPRIPLALAPRRAAAEHGRARSGNSQVIVKQGRFFHS